MNSYFCWVELLSSWFNLAYLHLYLYLVYHVQYTLLPSNALCSTYISIMIRDCPEIHHWIFFDDLKKNTNWSIGVGTLNDQITKHMSTANMSEQEISIEPRSRLPMRPNHYVPSDDLIKVVGNLFKARSLT